MVVVKSPEKLVPADLFAAASNFDKQERKSSDKDVPNHEEVTNFSTLLLNEQAINTNTSEENEEDNCSGYQSTDF